MCFRVKCEKKLHFLTFDRFALSARRGQSRVSLELRSLVVHSGVWEDVTCIYF